MPTAKRKTRQVVRLEQSESLAEKRRRYLQGQHRLVKAAVEAEEQHHRPPAMWVYNPMVSFKERKGKVPAEDKQRVQQQAQKFIDSILKPMHIQPPPRHPKFNYLVDIFSDWHGGPFFYFYAKYRCPGPNAISPYFKTPFARLQYAPGAGFNLAFHRYTGEWIEIEEMISLKKCFDQIRTSGFFIP
jgi:hypothetical protein